jgi:hypothetical protein
MANELMQGLLQSLLQTPEQQQQAEGVQNVNLLSQQNPLAATLAYMMPQRNAGMERGVRGLFGLPQQMTNAELATTNGASLTTSAGLKAAAQNAMATGNRPLALQFTLQAQETERAEQVALAERQRLVQAQQEQARSRTGLLNLVQGSSLPAAQKSALGSAAISGSFDGKVDQLLKYVYPEDEKRFLVVGNSVWDTTTGTWAEGASPEAVLGKEAVAASEASSIADLPSIDFDQYDPKAFAEADSAYKAATNDQERTSALSLLRPKLDAGEEWREVNGVTVPWPASGAPRREAESSISAFNQSKNNVLRKSDVIISTVDNILESIAAGKTDTGAASVLGYVPGTPWWNQRMNVDTLRANLGFGELQSMRAAAANGASGLGQLTERELSRLESLVGSLSTAQTRDQFVARMNDIRGFYAGLKTDYSARGDMTLEDYAGAPKSVFTIEEIE